MQSEGSPSATAATWNPFPGLRPFETTEGPLFFGREGQSVAILKLLRATRFVAVLGTSGSGKSSVVRAGLIPYLQETLASAESKWRVAILRPGEDPIGRLAEALDDPNVVGRRAIDADEALADSKLVEVRLRRSGLGLVEVVRLARLPEDQCVLIVIDQFEELFRFADAEQTGPADDAAAFVKLLLEAAAQRELPIYVVLTMRSDFIGDCARFRNLAEGVAAGLYLLPRMTRDQRRAAIEEPVRIAGGEIARRLVNRLLNDIGDDPDQLPILQHVLMRTWEQWKSTSAGSRPLDLDDYAAIGGIEDALSNHADEAYNELDTQGQDIARRMFQCLTEKGGDNREIRRGVTVQTIAEVAAPSVANDIADQAGARVEKVLPVIEAFRKPGRSFLMPPADVPLEPETVVDISHESLIRNWKRLRGWVDEETESAKIYRRLAETAALHADRKAALWQDPDLSLALAWKEQNRPSAGWSRRYNPGFQSAMDFLDASRKHRDVEARERRRQRVAGLALVVFAFVILGAAATYALVQKQKAETAAAEAGAALHQAQVRERETRLVQEDLSQQSQIARQQLLDANDELTDRAATLADWVPAGRKPEILRDQVRDLEAVKDFIKARKKIDQLQADDPGFLADLVTSSDIALLTGDADTAVHDAQAYLAVKSSAAAYGNLFIAQAMRRRYREAVAVVENALAVKGSFEGGLDEALISPDLQKATRGHSISTSRSDVVLAFRYSKVVYLAMAGDSAFEAALEAADGSDRDYPNARGAYFAALNWEWLVVRGQGRTAADAQGGKSGGPADPRRLADYGAYAAEGILWDRVAASRPVFADYARISYERFRDAFRLDRQPRYETLARWVEERMGGRHVPVPTDDNFSIQARDLALQANELKQRVGDHHDVTLSRAHERLSAAIDLLQAERAHHQLGRRDQEFLVDLMARRARWRLDADPKDKGGASDDAMAALEIDPDHVDAYRILAGAAFDAATSQRRYEEALRRGPRNASVMKNLAAVVTEKDPGRALGLLLQSGRSTSLASQDYVDIAKLQSRLGQHAEAVNSVDKALSMAPWRLSIVADRREIEKAAGYTDAAIGLDEAAGQRAVAEYYDRAGNDGQAVLGYLRAFKKSSALPENADVGFERQVIIRRTSKLIVARYGLASARLFWQSISEDPVMSKGERDLAAAEVSRLSKPP